MPELPEVQTTLNGIAPLCQGKTIAAVHIRQPKLRWPIPDTLPAYLDNAKIQEIERRAKYLLFHFKRGTMLIHLGMSGRIRCTPEQLPIEKHDHVDIIFIDGSCLRYTDPRRFGSILWADNVSTHKLLKDLGPEPLSNDFSAQYLYDIAQQKHITAKALLMNQTIVAGLGNIYVCESLFIAGIHPERATKTLTLDECRKLIFACKTVLTKAIKQGGTTLKDFANTDGKPGYFKQSLLVYGRDGEPCIECNTPLSGIRMNQRATVFCSRCQPLPPRREG